MRQSRILIVAAVIITIVYLANHLSMTSAVQLDLIASGFESPIAAVFPDDGSGRMFVASQNGKVLVVRNGRTLVEPLLDISSKVLTGYFNGLIGITVHPDYASSRLIYVSYVDLEGNHVIAQYQESGETNKVDPNSEQILLTILHTRGVHFGGDLAFGPDGYLHISSGDSSGQIIREHGQDRGNLLGKILRIDVDRRSSSGDPLYSIPDDNPFAGEEDVRGEIWLYGLRNPWRFSFDRETGDLYIGDAGHDSYEEIDYLPAGSPGGDNMGWPVMEGFHCFVRDLQTDQECDQAGYTPPVVEYKHEEGKGGVVIGGYVYRGSKIDWLKGAYLFANFGDGRISIARKSTGWKVENLVTGPDLISSFAQDNVGEIYVIDFVGSIYKIVPTPWWGYLIPSDGTNWDRPV